MKTKLLLILTVILGFSSKAQNYRFTLLQNSDYNYSLAAVPNFDSGSDIKPNSNQYNFTIMLQDGATIDQSSLISHHLTLDAFTITEATTLDVVDRGHDRSGNTIVSNGRSLFPEHLKGELIPLITFDVLGAPTTGEISILDNDSSLAMAASGTLDSFFSIDETGENSPTNLYAGLTGTTAYSFSTLSTPKQELVGVSLYPNPTHGNVFIKGVNDLESIEIMNVNGQRIMQLNASLETININRLNNGVYFVKLQTAIATKTIKLIKK